MSTQPVKYSYKGREIEIIAPADRHGRCAFTVNGHGPRPGERHLGNPGQSAPELLMVIKHTIDQRDLRHVRGTVEWDGPWYAPGTWEECPGSRGIGTHIKATGKDCAEDSCVAEARKKERARERAAQGHPSAGAIARQLTEEGFPHHRRVRRGESAFYVMDNAGGPETGVCIFWRGEQAAERLKEIADFLTSKDRYTVHHTGASTLAVVSKTHGAIPPDAR